MAASNRQVKSSSIVSRPGGTTVAGQPSRRNVSDRVVSKTASRFNPYTVGTSKRDRIKLGTDRVITDIAAVELASKSGFEVDDCFSRLMPVTADLVPLRVNNINIQPVLLQRLMRISGPEKRGNVSLSAYDAFTEVYVLALDTCTIIFDLKPAAAEHGGAISDHVNYLCTAPIKRKRPKSFAFRRREFSLAGFVNMANTPVLYTPRRSRESATFQRFNENRYWTNGQKMPFQYELPTLELLVALDEGKMEHDLVTDFQCNSVQHNLIDLFLSSGFRMVSIGLFVDKEARNSSSATECLNICARLLFTFSSAVKVRKFFKWYTSCLRSMNLKRCIKRSILIQGPVATAQLVGSLYAYPLQAAYLVAAVCDVTAIDRMESVAENIKLLVEPPPRRSTTSSITVGRRRRILDSADLPPPVKRKRVQADVYNGGARPTDTTHTTNRLSSSDEYDSDSDMEIYGKGTTRQLAGGGTWQDSASRVVARAAATKAARGTK